MWVLRSGVTMGGLAVFHIEKAKSTVGGLGNHIDRSTVTPNVNTDKSHLNRAIIDHRDNGGLQESIDKRINEGYKMEKAIRKDAVKATNVILSGSNHQLLKLEGEGKIDDWVDDNLKWLSKEFGKENIVSFFLHMDERTPHIHAVVVPLTKDGRLSAKEVMGNRQVFSERQDRYGKAMSEKYDLHRGLKGSTATHDSVQEYYARVNAPARDVLSSAKEIKKTPKGFKGVLSHVGLSDKESYYEVKKSDLDEVVLAQKGKEESFLKEVNHLSKQKEQLKRELSQSQKTVKAVVKSRDMLKTKHQELIQAINNTTDLDKLKAVINTPEKIHTRSQPKI